MKGSLILTSSFRTAQVQEVIHNVQKRTDVVSVRICRGQRVRRRVVRGGVRVMGSKCTK